MADPPQEGPEEGRMDELGARLRVYLATHGNASQRAAADALGVSRAHIRRIAEREGLTWRPPTRPADEEGDDPGEAAAGGEAPGEAAPPKASAAGPKEGARKPRKAEKQEGSPAKEQAAAPEGAKEAARKVHEIHSQKVATYAGETYDWILGAGREIWDLWDRSGYRAEFSDPESFVRYLVAFFNHWYPKIAPLVYDLEEAEADLDTWAALVDPSKRRLQARQELLATVLTAHVAGTPMTREEIAEIWGILQTPIVEQEGEDGRANQHTGE